MAVRFTKSSVKRSNNNNKTTSSNNNNSICWSLLQWIFAALIGLYVGLNLAQSSKLLSLNDNDNSNLSPLQLRDLQSQTKKWKERQDTTEKEYAEALRKIQRLEQQLVLGSGSVDNNKNGIICNDDNPLNQKQTRNNYFTNPHPICQQILSISNSKFIPSTSALWNDQLLNIFQATRLPNDRRFKFHDFTAELLQIITPRLPKSVKTTSQINESIRHVLDIAWARYQYLTLPKQEQARQSNPPRPLQILVMGGSLLVGTNCRKLLVEFGLSGPIRLPKRDCTWSNRLQQFFNLYFGHDDEFIQVTKVAMGGTNTATGSVILQYDLLPEELQQYRPDVIINAYSTNDMHILTVLEAQSSNITLRDRVFDMTQTFIRQVLSLHTTTSTMSNCNAVPPLLLHIDDYLGNEQHKIWETTELAQGVQVLANYYGFASMSYADVIRDIIYGDTYESWLSANWWGDNGSLFEREIHPGMGMHISATWVVLYNMLNILTTYCSIPENKNALPTSFDKNSNTTIQYQPGYLGLPALNHEVKQAIGKPKPPPSINILPPVLTKDLLLENVTTLWRNAAPTSACSSSLSTSTTHITKCPFSWVSGLSLQQNNETWVDEYFRKYSSTWNGWELSKDGGKLGFIPTLSSSLTLDSNNQIVLDFYNLSQPIHSVTLFIMKSYGEKWAKSELQVNAYYQSVNSNGIANTGNWQLLNSQKMVGYHDKETSEMYTEPIPLLNNDVTDPQISSLRLSATLIGGTTFKIMGLAICS